MLGIILVISSIYMSYMNMNDNIFLEFNEMLVDSQQVEYKKIIKERSHIYLMGTILGIILSLIYYYKNKYKYRVCMSVVILYMTKIIFYKIYPKSPLMLYHLTNREQVNKWADIYLHMKKRWLMSFVIGFIGYIMIFITLQNYYKFD